mmetsp:Transcript_5812/g.11646  ORF Transcript_5812/g.11646 Transcript_5812/m.11646 type:complete len:671 (+) Transcript_5812:105-2117(+)
MGAPPVEYPVQLGLAYLFLVGYFARSFFLSVKLPGAVGVILSGFAFSYFMQADILHARDQLQQLAFFLVLLTAGFEISLWDLRPYILVMAWLPAALELFGIAFYGAVVLGYTWVEALVLGTCLFCIGDGLVIPKMNDFGRQFKDHPLPRLIFMTAPLEASFALTFFGILVGLSEPAHQTSPQIGLVVLANVLRIVATLATGALLGAASGWLIPRRSRLRSVTGQPVFTGASVEAFLMILAVALAAFGIGMEQEGGRAFVPIGFCMGSLFQPELLVIVMGTFFGAVSDSEVLRQVEQTMGGVWVFGQLVLFSMLGSRTETGAFAVFMDVLPIMVVGIAFRLAGVFLATIVTQPMRPCRCTACRQANWASICPDALFCFLSTLPRATIQGALGAVPSTQRFFQGDPRSGHVQNFIADSARIYIVCMAVLGSVFLDAIGPMALRATARRKQQFPCTGEHVPEKGFQGFSPAPWCAADTSSGGLGSGSPGGTDSQDIPFTPSSFGSRSMPGSKTGDMRAVACDSVEKQSPSPSAWSGSSIVMGLASAFQGSPASGAAGSSLPSPMGVPLRIHRRAFSEGGQTPHGFRGPPTCVSPGGRDGTGAGVRLASAGDLSDLDLPPRLRSEPLPCQMHNLYQFEALGEGQVSQVSTHTGYEPGQPWGDLEEEDSGDLTPI